MISKPASEVSNPKITLKGCEVRLNCNIPKPIRIKLPQRIGVLIIENQVLEWKTMDVIVKARIIADIILNPRPRATRFSYSRNESGMLDMAIPRIAPAIHPATILTTAISTGQEVLTNINTPIYWTANAPMQ